MAIIMELRDGTRYELDDAGYVTARSDGPRGWDYGRGWRVLGFRRRLHSAFTITLDAALNGTDTGFGYVMDWDHGTYRMWASPKGRRMVRLYRVP